MKTKQQLIIVFAIMFLGTLMANAQEQTQNVEIQISNIESEKGHIRIGLYKGAHNFYKKTFRSTAVQSKKGSLKVILENIPSGEYAISLYHDINDNKTLDTNLFRIPKEPYGTSNNAKGYFGPPTWEDAKFSVLDQKVIQSITL